MKQILLIAIIILGTLNLTAQVGSYQETDSHSQGISEKEYVDSLASEIANLNKRLTKIEQDNENKRIWGRARYTRLGINKAQTALEGCHIEDNKWSFFLSKGATYRFPSNPIAGILKIGLDMVWFDFMVSRYTNPFEYSAEYTEGDDHGASVVDLGNIGRYSVCIGMFGIGPNISCAPFAKMGVRGLRPLRASVYFHYQPTGAAYLMSDHGESEASYAFCNMFDFGGNISYRSIALGLEGKWGKCKFKSIGSELLEDIGLEFNNNSKSIRRFANTRIYMQFSF